MFDNFLASTESRSQPLARQAIAKICAYIALRTSTDPRPAAVFTRLVQESIPEVESTNIKLNYLYTRGQLKECLPIIDHLDSDTLALPGFYETARATLLQTGRVVEAGLLDETMRAHLKQAISETWMPNCNYAWITYYAKTVNISGAADLISDAWFRYQLDQWREPVRRASLMIQQAWWRKDWTSLHEAADEGLHHIPDFYDLYYDRGMASYHLGDKTAALKDLKVFVEHSRNDIHFPDAEALVHELSNGTRPPTGK